VTRAQTGVTLAVAVVLLKECGEALACDESMEIGPDVLAAGARLANEFTQSPSIQRLARFLVVMRVHPNREAQWKREEMYQVIRFLVNNTGDEHMENALMTLLHADPGGVTGRAGMALDAMGKSRKLDTAFLTSHLEYIVQDAGG